VGPLEFVQAGLRRFRSPAGLYRPRFRLARPLGRCLSLGLGRFPLCLSRRDRLRGSGLGLPNVLQPFRDPAHDSGHFSGALVGGGGPVLRGSRALAGFLGSGLCGS
jgi:hypothetical protein